MNVKQTIIDTLRATKYKNIETVINYMEKHGFFTYHCHHHHHYNGGLADHAWQTYQIALDLNAENRANNPKAKVLDENSISYNLSYVKTKMSKGEFIWQESLREKKLTSLALWLNITESKRD